MVLLYITGVVVALTGPDGRFIFILKLPLLHVKASVCRTATNWLKNHDSL